MAHEDSLSFDDFKVEWQPDTLNVIVEVYWFKDENEAQVLFAHPRRLSMSAITVTDLNRNQLQMWLDLRQPKSIEIVEL